MLFIAGPCVLESEETALETAGMLSSLFEGRESVEWVFKASFLKDNRTSPGSYRGPGMERGRPCWRLSAKPFTSG